MGGERGVEMAAGEIDAFLGRGGTAVLALARADEPYATPVSYGYDGDRPNSGDVAALLLGDVGL